MLPYNISIQNCRKIILAKHKLTGRVNTIEFQYEELVIKSSGISRDKTLVYKLRYHSNYNKQKYNCQSLDTASFVRLNVQFLSTIWRLIKVDFV